MKHLIKWLLIVSLVLTPLLNLSHTNAADGDSDSDSESMSTPTVAQERNDEANGSSRGETQPDPSNSIPILINNERDQIARSSDGIRRINFIDNNRTILHTDGLGDELARIPLYEKKDTSLSTQFMDYIKGIRHFKKDRGMEDGHFPERISFKEKKMLIPPDKRIPELENAMEGSYLNLYALTFNLLHTLSEENLEALISYLSTKKIHIKIHYKGKHALDDLTWHKTDAATALALTMGAQQQHAMLSYIIAIAPNAVLPELEEKAPSLLCKYVTACTLITLIKKINDGNTAFVSQISASLVRIYIKYWAGKDAEKLNEALKYLVFQIHAYQGSVREFTPQQLGVLLGSLLAGTLIHCNKIKSTDEKRQWMINSTSNLIWAATTFLGVCPWFAANVAAAIAGGISVGVVGAAVVYNYARVPRDYSSIVREVEGQIRMSALQSAKEKDGEIKIRVLEMLEFVTATIQLNGQTA